MISEKELLSQYGDMFDAEGVSHRMRKMMEGDYEEYQAKYVIEKYMKAYPDDRTGRSELNSVINALIALEFFNYRWSDDRELYVRVRD